MKNQYKVKNLLIPLDDKEAASNVYVDNRFNDPSILKNTGHVHFNDKILKNVRFVEVNSLP